MNSAQLHLVLNHLPIIIPGVGLFALTLGLILKEPKFNLLALWIFILGTVLSIPTYLTGESAESVVKNYPVFSQRWATAHEALALKALIASLILSALSAVLLIMVRRGKQIEKTYWLALVILSIATLALLVQTAHHGGQITHEEIRINEFSNEQ